MRIIHFSRNIHIDIEHVPDNLEQIIKDDFTRYTAETRKEYRHQDKLGYIDVIRRAAHNAKDHYDVDADGAVNEIIKERFEYELEENGEIMDRDDFFTEEFMSECYQKGYEHGNCDLNSKYGSTDHHVYDKIMQIVYRAVKAVMDWEEKDE